MEIIFHDIDGKNIAEVRSGQIVVSTPQDALDLMVECSYEGSQAMILRRENIIPEFFDLKTRVAGEILQKYSNYFFKLAIIGDFSNIASDSLRRFINESNRVGQVVFVSTLEEAKDLLSRK
jgi:hypothetical protein